MTRYEVLKVGIEKIPKIKYEVMYKKLEEMKFALKKDPVEYGFGPITVQISEIQTMKSDLQSMILEGIRNKDKWQRAYRAVCDLVKSRKGEMMLTPEVQELKSDSLRWAKAESLIPGEMALLKETEKHYFLESNSTAGEAVHYLNALYAVKDTLISANDNLKTQLQVVQNMLNVGEITSAEIVQRAFKRKVPQGEVNENGS